jgi:hypothetical protein
MGGGVYVMGEASLTHCTLVGNLAPAGGGCHTDGADVIIESCTMYGNGADHGAGVSSVGGQVLLTNTIVAFSSFGNAVDCDSEFTTHLECCDLFGNAGGDWIDHIAWLEGYFGNLSADPMFCNADSLDFHLWELSPCAEDGECGLIGAWPVGCWSSPSHVSKGDPAIGAMPRLICSPNPFGETTVISYVMLQDSAADPVSLRVFDVTGRLMRVLSDGEHSLGVRAIPWDGRDDSGLRVPTGTYFARLSSGDRVLTKLILLAR